MMAPLYTLLAQFGDGFTPVVENDYTADVLAQDGLLNTVALILSNVLGVLTILGGIFFIVYFIVGVFNWIIAGGDSAKVGKAMEQLRNATIGILLLISSYAIIGLIGAIVGFDLLDIRSQIELIIPN